MGRAVNSYQWFAMQQELAWPALEQSLEMIREACAGATMEQAVREAAKIACQSVFHCTDEEVISVITPEITRVAKSRFDW